jgi:gamma-glutamyltranspeptidase/glutathione hydrolase
MSILERGGSAADAAIAGVLTVGVAQPVSSGIGGGGFAVVWHAKSKRATVLDFREAAPVGISLADYRRRPPPPGKEGVMTGVPGEIAGLFELHARFGKLALAEDMRGAAETAAKGFPVSAHLARVLKMNERWILKSPRLAFFHPAGSLLGVSETAANPALAATLQRIAAEGKAAFYEGAIAADVLATARDAGSRMTESDLKRYAVIEREPLRTTWEGHEVITMPPPSAGGLMILEALAMHSKADLNALGYGTGAYFHMLAETFRGAIADRMLAIGDPAFVRSDPAALASPERMKARRARISLDATTPAEKFRAREAGTSHLVAVDEEGNVVAITSTVNNMFGAKIVAKGGFFLNDELDDFTTDTISRRFGLQRGPNAPRGGARPASSMTPTIVLKDGAPVLALGGSGGPRIATATTQVLLAHLAFGRPVSQAVADIRIETPFAGGLALDAAAPAEIAKDLEDRGEVVNTTLPNFSAVQAVSISHKDGARVIEAASDPRKGGTGAVE